MATALILGATGGIGHEVATALHRHGWQINALHRDPAKAASHGRTPWIHWVKGDAMNAAEVTRAAEGASVIVHAVNPPGYRNWGQLVIPMIDSSIGAARTHGARILLPGTIYNFGPDAFPTLRENSPQNPLTRQGKDPRRAGSTVAGLRRLRCPIPDCPRRRFLRTQRGKQLVLAGARQTGPTRHLHHLSGPPCVPGMRGPTCPISPKPWPNCSTGSQHWARLSAFISRAIGTLTALT